MVNVNDLYFVIVIDTNITYNNYYNIICHDSGFYITVVSLYLLVAIVKSNLDLNQTTTSSDIKCCRFVTIYSSEIYM